MGLDVYLYPGTGEDLESVEFPSAKYPDHLFKIGYFRSSYNDGGINSVARQFGLPGLYEIFGVDREEYVISPDWKTCMESAKAALEKWKEYADSHSLSVIQCDWLPDEDVNSSNAALDVYNKDTSKESTFDSWQSKHGFFTPKEAIRVVGAINGGRFGSPTVYLICQSESGKLDWLESYIQSIEIVIETCEYVLAQPNPESYVLHWSG